MNRKPYYLQKLRQDHEKSTDTYKTCFKNLTSLWEVHGLVNLNPDGKHSKIKNSKGSSVPGDANHFFVDCLPALSSDVSSTAIGPNDSMEKKRKKQGRSTFTKSSSSPCIDSPSIYLAARPPTCALGAIQSSMEYIGKRPRRSILEVSSFGDGNGLYCTSVDTSPTVPFVPSRTGGNF